MQVSSVVVGARTALSALATAAVVLSVVLGCATDGTEAAPVPATAVPEASPGESVGEPAPVDEEQSPMAVLLISGRINFDAGEVTLDPARALPTTKPVKAGSGDYSVELLDAEGAVLTSRLYRRST